MAFVNPALVSTTVVSNYFFKESFCISVIMFITEWCRSLRKLLHLTFLSVIGVLLGLMLFAILRWILAVIGGVTGWDYLLLCLLYNSVCLFLVEGYDAYVYQIMC